MRSTVIVACVVLACGTSTAWSQKVVGSGIVVANGNSTVTVENPNEEGTYVLKLPQVPHLQPGETMLMQLQAVGTPTGAILSFAAPGSTEALTRQPTDALTHHSTTAVNSVQVDGVRGPSVKVVHAFAELDLPQIGAGEGFVVRVNIPNVRAGAAISVSPAGEMTGGLHPAYGWAPIDCVVLIKFTNAGASPADLEPMQFGIGAINPD